MTQAHGCPLSAYCVEKLPQASLHHVFGGTSPLALSEIVDPGPFYEVDFSTMTYGRTALEFFNRISLKLTARGGHRRIAPERKPLPSFNAKVLPKAHH
jgi:hypothetical protein